MEARIEPKVQIDKSQIYSVYGRDEFADQIIGWIRWEDSDDAWVWSPRCDPYVFDLCSATIQRISSKLQQLNRLSGVLNA